MTGRGIAIKLRAYAVHVFTALGGVLAFFAAMELCAAQPNPVVVFIYLAIAGVVDALDGPMARRWNVLEHAPSIDGAKLDDIIDFLNFTFLPLLLIWRMGWVPEPAVLWILPALVASLFGFTNTRAKQSGDGFFLGFPSYWNLVAFYVGLWAVYFGPGPAGWALLILAALTVLPVRFIYPNQVSAAWRGSVLIGGSVWFAVLLAMLPFYLDVPEWIMWFSLSYPAFYALLSMYLDISQRRAG